MSGRCSCCLEVLKLCAEAERHGMKSIDIASIQRVVSNHRTPQPDREMLVVDLHP